MRRRACIFALVALAAILAACGGSSAAPATPTAEPSPTPSPAITIPRDTPITVAVSAALTGDQAGPGKDIADAVELAAAEHGPVLGHDVEIKRLDDGCTDPEKAVAAAKSLVGAGTVAGVIGPMCTVGAQAANSVYESAHIVHISATATRTDLSAQSEHYFFRTAWHDEAQAMMQAEFLIDELEQENVILVDDGEPYGVGLADVFEEEFEARGGTIVSRERVARGTIDFSSLARQVQNAKPGAVVFEGLNPEGALLVKALRENGYKGLFVGPDGLLNVKDFLEAAGTAADGAVLTGGAFPDEGFSLRFIDRFQRAPSTPFVLQSFDAMSLLLKAIEKTAQERNGRLIIDREALAAALHDGKFDGMTGPISFGENGDREGDTAGELGLTIYRVKDGSFQPLP